MTTHLLQLGHERIAHLTAQRSALAADEHSVESDRFQGYLRALTEAGVAFDPAWVLQGETTP
jgi:LacI family transcriptional regulator